MSTLVLTLILAFSSSSAWAAIAFDGASGGIATSAASVTYSHTVTSNTNGVLYVCTMGQQSGSPGVVSSVTYNAVALTRIQSQVCNESGAHCKELWRLKAPATGANNVVITFPGSIGQVVGASSSYTGVDQTNSEGTPVTASDDTGSSTGPITVNVSSSAGSLVIDCASPYFAAVAPTVGAGQTVRGLKDDTANTGTYLGMSEEAGAATVTMSWTLGATPRTWGTIGVSLNAAGGGGGGGSARRTLSLLGAQ